MKIKALPEEERPRERLVLYGSEALSLSELIAIILGSGSREKNVLKLAEEIVSHFQTLKALLEASVSELLEIKGIGRAKAVQLKAALCLARRLVMRPSERKERIDSPRAAYAWIQEELEGKKEEVVLVLLRDVKKRFLHRELIGRGTISEVLIHPREVFYPAIRNKAKSFILAHNHPSGNPFPSDKDYEMTQLLSQGAEMLGINFVDHLIIGEGCYFSFSERKILPNRY